MILHWTALNTAVSEALQHVIRQAMYYNSTEARSRNDYCRGKVITVTYSACPVLQYISTLSLKAQFSEESTEHEMCFDFLYKS